MAVVTRYHGRSIKLIENRSMTQNIYDDPTFFAGYSQLPRSVDGLNAAPEWPSLQALLPDLRNARIVDLGCGFGWFCRWARQQGAAQVLGIDVSENMLARAKASTADPAISYLQADLERLDLAAASADLVYSSLAFHYLENLEGLLTQVYRALVPGGRLVFSVEHPLLTAPIQPSWQTGPDGRRTWPIDSYLIEGPRRTNWLAEGVIKQHRTTTSYLNLLLRSGFALSHLEEWGPTDAQVAADPLLAEERQRPTFMLVAARR
jgi:SAM-dependent methyltransferase